MLKRLFASLFVLAVGVASAEPVTLAVDPEHAVVTFEALHLGTSTHRGRFRAKEGSIVIDRAARTGKADVTLDMTSLSMAVPSLEAVLKGERMFNVAQFPTARFVGDSFTFDNGKVASVTGSLTIVGKTQPATLTAVRFNCYESSMLKREVCGGDFETTIQRSQFGLTFLPNVSPDNVKLLIQVEAIRQ
jgi:polyisoprenoid-binding protein YceI